MNYQQALNKQLYEKAGNVIVRIERLPDKYRLTTRDGTKHYTTLAFGLKHYPIAIYSED